MQGPKDAARSTLDTAALEGVLRDSPVTLVVLYGSHARGDATPGSDIDLAVTFDDSLSAVDRTHARLELIARLSAALETDDVDVVPLSHVPPALRRAIHEDGLVVYGNPADLGDEPASESVETSHEDRLAEFDEVLAALERVV